MVSHEELRAHARTFSDQRTAGPHHTRHTAGPRLQRRGGGKPRRHYDENFKRNAVELTLRGERSVTQVAAELGVAESMLYEWRRKYAPRPGATTGAPQTLEQATEEIARLRSEVVRLQEREIILKKSLGILSETPESGMPRSKR